MLADELLKSGSILEQIPFYPNKLKVAVFLLKCWRFENCDGVPTAIGDELSSAYGIVHVHCICRICIKRGQLNGLRQDFFFERLLHQNVDELCPYLSMSTPQAPGIISFTCN